MHEGGEGSGDRLVELIVQHHDSIRAGLGYDDYELLRSKLQAYAETPKDGSKAALRAMRGVRLVLDRLPSAHPVRQALDGPRFATAMTLPTDTIVAEALAVLSSQAFPSTATIIAAAKNRLLQAPALSAEGVRARWGQSPPSGLIVLADPQHGDRYPAFQFTADEGTPHEVVLEVNRLLLADIDPWGVADWWLSDNEWLGGQPAALIGELADSRLLRAAMALVEEI
ncbi:hypothetical protein [Streptomyces sp. CBMA29]|uniref:hypothetical protein n=1 Tax=Streptomyces sp. CBMA29 TaxID=1896314 RepID=UPI001661EC1A|nr:hypothetical protein [Streptomyces sp. CBMA29]MBD0737661.1 hypothetical protein [Streptomyces sp. CBMA29]